jgi:hypothetical protein
VRYVDPVSSALARLVSRCAPTADGWVDVSVRSWDLDDFPDAVESVRIYHSPMIDEPFWSLSGCLPNRRIGKSELERVVAKKSKAAAEYRSQFDETWLLMVIDGFRIGSAGSLDEESARVSYRSQFTRALVLRDRRVVHELDVIRCEPNKRATAEGVSAD